MSKQPTTWDEALTAANLVDPRNGRPSFNQLAKRAGMPQSTISAIVQGTSNPKPTTISKIAKALGVDVLLVSSWVGEPRTERAPYTPPAEADLLNDRQRRAVDEIIRAIVAERASERDERNRMAHGAISDRAVEDGPTTSRLSVVPGKLPSSEREELYRRAEQVDLDAEPHAAAGPEDTSDDDESV
ncbi:helix-turn-helix transcriptional regulator [Brachybacterium halotolerans subsp. kimchii]|uniref:helix-turn-helix domain-containing protein n=1 Tax=Brachybacterium halotolerans TaxID=2795215 RepID=UPI001E60B5A1|nr:helix-turn-helix transcriptional regulator [Brachybacterium halotolerans]UEJ83949.1 helix-turn-helix transcriptional regulator [Brachybacterium halotolerans subsp. kimchii]